MKETTTLNRKYSYLLDRFEKLKKYKKKYDKEKEEIVYFALQRIAEEVVETAIKINIYFLKEEQIFPKTYQESFLLLEEYLDFNEKELKELAKTAKFRNLLAHEYILMPEEEFLKNISKIIKIYPKYLKTIYREF